MPAISQRKRSEILDALRRGTVPNKGLDALAVGLGRFESAVAEMLENASAGQATFKAVRGEYGCGKTFFSRWLQERAKERNFAASEVQISEVETPIHRLETVYRRMLERLSIRGNDSGAFRAVVDSWFFGLEEEVMAGDPEAASNPERLLAKTNELMEKRLSSISRTAPLFGAALRGYRNALGAGDNATADGLLAWLAGQPNVAASIKRYAGLKGDMDASAALNFLQGLLLILRDSGHPGLVLVIDEVETLQRVRSDTREKGLNTLRQLIDGLDAGLFPGLFLVITGTPAFYDGPQGVKKSQPLAQRLQTDFDTDIRFDNPRASQIRLKPFDMEMMLETGTKVRDIFAEGSRVPERIRKLADDGLIHALASGVSGSLGGKTGIAPRLFLKKLVADLLDRIELFPEFDPAKDYRLTLRKEELTPEERNLTAADSVEDISLDV